MNDKRLLFIFFLTVLFKQIAWISLVPLFQTPDEQAHFGQIQNISEFNFEAGARSSKELEIVEKKLGLWRDQFGNNKYTYNPEYNVIYTNSVIGKYESILNSIPKNDRRKLSFVEATVYPPLYYQYSAIGYRLINQTSIIDRVFFLRLWQTVFYLLTVFVYYLIGKNLIHSLKRLYLFLGTISFLPMPSFVAAGINSDNLFNLIFTLVIYINILIIKKGLRVRYFLLLFCTLVLGWQTKTQYLIAIPITVTAILIRLYFKGKKKTLLFLIFSLFAFLLLCFSQIDKLMVYIPSVDNIQVFQISAAVGLFTYFKLSLIKFWKETWPWFWGVYRWLSLGNPDWLRRLFNLISVISGAVMCVYLIRAVLNRKKCQQHSQLQYIIFFIFSIIIYWLILFFWDYLFYLGHRFSFGFQGRYYFPVLFPFIFLMFFFISKISYFKQYMQMTSWIMAMISSAANVFILYYLVVSYYDKSSIQVFLIQASQYKPHYFKNGFILLWIGLYLIFLFVLLKNIWSHKDEN